MLPTPAELVRFCPACGAKDAGPVGRVPFDCRACGLVLFFNPTVSAAAFIRDPAGRVLFIRRAHAPAQGKLGVPGGFVDFGEAADEALRREVREEVGIEVAGLTYLCSAANRYDYKGVRYSVCDMIYTAEAVAPETARPLDAVAGIEWHRPADVAPDELAFPSLRRGWEALAARGGG